MKKRMQREPYSKLEVGLRQGDITVQRVVQPLKFVRHEYLKVVVRNDSY